jgi:hypothetical protein
MVSRNEIRAGNWLLMVFEKEKNSRVVINYQPKVIQAKDFKLASYCLPISLTTKLLDKCGFIYELHAWCKYRRLKGNRVMVLQWKEKEGWLIGNQKIKVPPFYLHQLQNLYYALTGDELKVGLNTYKAFDRSTLIL